MRKSTTGFTIVELLIVIVVIAILAAISVVAFNGISTRAKESSVKSDLTNSAKLLETKKILDGSYPANQTSAGLKASSDNSMVYMKSPVSAIDGYCLSLSNEPIARYVWSWNSSVHEGTCPGWFWVTKGNPGPLGGTNYLRVSTQFFTAGSYKIRCLNGSTAGSYSTYTLQSTGFIQLSCWSAGTNGAVSVEIENVGVSPSANW